MRGQGFLPIGDGSAERELLIKLTACALNSTIYTTVHQDNDSRWGLTWFRRQPDEWLQLDDLARYLGNRCRWWP